MNEIIQEKYPPESYNIFGFHVSDGDNLSTDNPACKRLIEKLCKDIVMFGYVEINPNQRPSTLNNVYKELKSLDNLQQVQIVEKNQDIYQALKLFFPKTNKGKLKMNNSLSELVKSKNQIHQLANDFGLDYYEMIYEIVPSDIMYALSSYGMPYRFHIGVLEKNLTDNKK